MGSCRHMVVDRCGSNRSISSRRDGNRISSSYYRLTIPFIMHRPNGGLGDHLIVVLTLLAGTSRSRHPRPTLRWASCTSASGAEDSGIWPRSVPLHSGSKVHATAVVSRGTATTTSSPTSTTHTHMPTLLAIQVASTGGGGNMPWPRQQQQHLMVDGTMPWRQQDPQQQQPQQQLISYDSNGGWVRGCID